MSINDYDNTWPVKPERTGWRDEGISQRHRRWGFNCPAVDLDFTLCEYDNGIPFALIEYKAYPASPTCLSHPTMRALMTLGDRAKLPVFLTVYTTDYAIYHVQPLNYYARDKQAVDVDLSETEYVSFLYRLRGRKPNGQLF